MHDQVKCTCKRCSTWQTACHLTNTIGSQSMGSSQCDGQTCTGVAYGPTLQLCTRAFGGVVCLTSEQLVDLRESNQRRDHADTTTFVTWLNLHNPFQRASPLLASLASDVASSAAVNCDDALSVGEASMKAMEGKLFSEIHLQRNNNVRTLASMTKAVQVRGEAPASILTSCFIG